MDLKNSTKQSMPSSNRIIDIILSFDLGMKKKSVFLIHQPHHGKRDNPGDHHNQRFHYVSFVSFHSTSDLFSRNHSILPLRFTPQC